MRTEKLYRYTVNGEGLFSVAKRLLPEELMPEINKIKGSIPNPDLPKGNYRFYLKEKGKEVYLKNYNPIHKKYLKDIKMETFDREEIDNVIYEDDFQVVEEIKNA